MTKRNLVCKINHFAHPTVYIELEGLKRVYAISDEALECETDTKSNAVHFRRFNLTKLQKKPLNTAQRLSVIAPYAG